MQKSFVWRWMAGVAVLATSTTVAFTVGCGAAPIAEVDGPDSVLISVGETVYVSVKVSDDPITGPAIRLSGGEGIVETDWLLTDQNQFIAVEITGVAPGQTLVGVQSCFLGFDVDIPICPEAFIAVTVQ